MQKLGGAVILMQPNLNNDNNEILNKLSILVGSKSSISEASYAYAKKPFDEHIIEFLNKISQILMGKKESKAYPDIVTLGFWIRKSSMMKLKEKYDFTDSNIHIGRGVVFHIAPSNVPVNYAYSLFTGLIMGNANIVRIPSKDFPQVKIINDAINQALEEFDDLRPYVNLVRYDRNTAINDYFSSISDVRVVWGGDATIAELRKSAIPPRATEITFADRYSLAVIDSDEYLSVENKSRIANDFYNDTFLTDQNACTSPRIVVWTGNKIEEAKKEFWENLYSLVKTKYTFQPIMGINKLTSSYMAAAVIGGTKVEKTNDNMIVRVKLDKVCSDIMEFKDNSGYFFEYDCKDILELKDLCNNTHCQTIGFLGNKDAIFPLISSGIKGVDRVVPIGKTMDFDFIWDGYNLCERLTRTIAVGV